MPRCLGSDAVGAGHEDAPVAVATARAPHLLTVHDEAVAVALGRRAQRREVAAGARLAEELAPHLVGGQRLAQVAGLLLLGRAEAHDGLAGQHDADHVDERRHAGAGALLDPHRVVLGREALAAPFGGPVDAGPPGRRRGGAATPTPRSTSSGGRMAP